MSEDITISGDLEMARLPPTNILGCFEVSGYLGLFEDIQIFDLGQFKQFRYPGDISARGNF